MSEHDIFIRQANGLAQEAVAAGNHPFGALLVLDGEVILRGQNTVETRRDVTHHAELNLVSEATRRFDPEVLKRVTLYTSTEPCAMCAGAIVWSGIRHVVFGCGAITLGALINSPFVIPSAEIFSRATPPVRVTGPILEEEGVQIHNDFWRMV